MPSMATQCGVNPMSVGRDIPAVLLTSGDLIEYYGRRCTVETWKVVSATVIQLWLTDAELRMFRPSVPTDSPIKIFNR